MADGKIKISELDEALQLSDNAEFPYSQDNGGVPTTFKAPANQIARKVAEGSTFTNLETTNKTLVGAINELSHLGNPILLGTTAPTSSQGANGNLYVQYTEGTGGAPDTVDSIYAKIDGAWCEIETGGGGGGSGGHTIVDDSGTALTQRTNLQFNGAYSEDNSTDDTTEVNVVREMTKAEFDELTEAEKTGLINITDITGGNDDRFQPVIYSTEEREIGVWEDGKPLYEKTYHNSSITIASNTELTIDDFSDKFPVSCYGVMHNSTDNRTYYPNWTYTSGNIYYRKNDSGNLVLRSESDSWGNTWEVFTVVRYTKNSDVAGSGQWTPQGVPAHHYSTDEQIVGTWIDGSTLYEQTVTNIPLSHNSWTTIFDADAIGATVIEYQGVISLDGTTPYCQLEYYRNSGEFSCTSINNNQLKLLANIQAPEKLLWATIRYIKSV